MPVFGRTKQETIKSLTPAKEGEATLGEMFNTFYDEAYFANGRRDVESTNYRDQWKPILEVIKKTTGKEFTNPGSWLYLPTPDDRNTSTLNPYPEFNPDAPEASLQAAEPLYNRQELYDTSANKVFDYIAENPDLFANVPEVQNLNGTVIADRVKEKVLEVLATNQKLDLKQKSTLDYIAGFGGSIAATVTDVPNLAVTGLTLLATKGRGMGIAKTMTVEAFANAGAEAFAQEEVMDWYASLDLPYSMDEFYYNLAAAATGGAVLSGGIKVAAKVPNLTAEQWRKGKVAIDKYNAKKAGLEYKEDLTLNSAVKTSEIESEFEAKSPYTKESDPSGEKNINAQNQAAQAIIEENPGKLPITPASELKTYAPLDADVTVGAILVDPDNIEVDAKLFQFKEGGDEFGVTERLQDVTEWDPVKSNVAILYETKEGKLFVVDGHQRVALAKKLKSQEAEASTWGKLSNDFESRLAELTSVFRQFGPVQSVNLAADIADGKIKTLDDLAGYTDIYNTMFKGKSKKAKAKKSSPQILGYVRKETDGVSIEAVRAEAAAKNIAEGSGTLVDAAKIFRDDPGLIKLLPPRSKLVQQAQGLSNLSDDAFMAAINGVITPEYAAIVGKYIDGSANQLATIKLLQRTNPQNATQAESIVAQAKTIGFEKAEQAGLFGDEVIAESAFLSRAKILDATVKFLKDQKSVFKTLVDDASVIEQYGNKLSKLTNAQKDKVYGQAIETIKQNANNVGPIADNLTTIAKEFEAAGSKNIGEFAKKFSESLERGIKSGNFERISTSERSSVIADTKKVDTSNSIAREYDDPSLKQNYENPVELTKIKQELSDLEAEIDQLATDNNMDDMFAFENAETGEIKVSNIKEIKAESAREQKIIDELKDC
tara:strand:- start:2563 stop:5217 length:2655 start_codon:yes stop_codon:yes gene_type:complete